VARQKITSSSTAEYFSKNLQQVGFSSPTKAVLTTLKEAVDNSLDACEEEGIAPTILIEIEKLGPGTMKNTDLIRIKVEDNGPGLDPEDVPKVFGEYLASSKFGRGRCSRGQQGIGISAATTWAQLTSGKGANVITKTKTMRQAQSLVVEVDIKNNRGNIKDKKPFDWKKPHGVSVEFQIDGRLQIHGDGGLLTYLQGTSLVNPHLALKYKIADMDLVDLPRVSDTVPEIPTAVEPHPHTMKLGEFIAHSHLFGRVTLDSFLKKGFSRVTDNVIKEFVKNGLHKKLVDTLVDKITDTQFKEVYSAIQKSELLAPSTKSVMTIGEEAFSKSIRRLGEIDFFAVVTRKPTICDSKPVVIEVAVARLSKGQKRGEDGEEAPSTVLRFANRVPLQFDKAACAMMHAVNTVNWRAYGLTQSRDSAPSGPYVIAVSLVSPFIKFKNASKETVDASDELVEEMRRALMQVGQRLSRHIRKETREADLEEKLRHIEQFGPILVEALCRIVEAPEARRKRAMEGLEKLLGRDVSAAKKDLKEAVEEARIATENGKLQVIDKEAEKAIQDETIDKDVIEANEVEEQITKKGKHRGTAPKTKPRIEKGKKPEAVPPAGKNSAKTPSKGGKPSKSESTKDSKKAAAKTAGRKKEKGAEA